MSHHHDVVRRRAEALLEARAHETVGRSLPRPTLVREAEVPPTPVEAAQEQVAVAKQRLQIDPSQYPRFPWKELDEIVGRLRVGSLVIPAASTGQGKTTFLMSAINGFAEAGYPVYMCGLEQTPDELRIKLACLRINLDPSIALENRFDEIPNGDALARALHDELESQATGDLANLVYFDPRRTIGYEEFTDAANHAIIQGKRILIIDHIDRLGNAGEGFKEMSRMVRFAKDLAVDKQLVVILASQMNRNARAGDRLAVYSPPQLHHLQMGGTKEHEADLVLGLWRPIKPDANPDLLKRVREGKEEPKAVLMPNTMGLVVMKHRIRGAAEGSRCFLQVKNGRVSDRPVSLPYSLDNKVT